MTRSELAARLSRALIIHTPPRRRGRRIYRLTERLAGRPDRPLVARHISGYRIACNLDDAVQRSLFYKGTYEPAVTAIIARALRLDDRFLDVGANAGHYTFLAARIIGPGGEVHAIEATPDTAAQLTREVARNGLENRVTVWNRAAFDRRAMLAIREPLERTQIGERRVDPEAAGEILALPLDELLPGFEPAVVKVDVEGADLRALVGMRQMLDRARPRLVVVEAHKGLPEMYGDSVDAILDFMRRLAYSATPIGDPAAPAAFAFTTPDVRHAR